LPVIAGLSAEVISLDGREAVIGQVLQGISTFQITIRYRDDIKASDQVLWRGLELNIVAPPADRRGTKQWTTIHASTQAPQGAGS
jgi:SPP1 family predicted phage head-tail adaptor